MKVPQVTMGLNTKMIIHDLNQHGTVTRYHVCCVAGHDFEAVLHRSAWQEMAHFRLLWMSHTDSSVVHFVDG